MKDLELNLWQSMHFNNCCMKQKQLKINEKHIIDNYNDKSLMEKVVIINKNSRKWHLEREMSIMREMLSYSQTGYKKLALWNPIKK